MKRLSVPLLAPLGSFPCAPQSLDQVAVISHRGEHLAHPENTLPAFQAAIDAGADFFELDVRTALWTPV